MRFPSKASILRKRNLIWVVVVCVIGLIAYNIIVPKPVPQDKTYTVTKTNLEDTISFPGEIDAGEKATLQFQTAGRLTWVGVKEGDRVEAGQSVATLDQRQLRKQLEKSLNLYATTRNSFDQSKDDNEDKIPVEKPEVADELKRILQNSQYSLNNSVLDVELQDLAIQYSNLSTPISGIVTRIGVPYAGVNIIPTQATFEIINPSTVYFSALIDQTDIVSVHETMTGKITLDAYPERQVAGTIQSLSFTPQQDETGTVYEAKLTILDPDLQLFRLGMTGDVTFTLGSQENVLVIPIRYLREKGDDQFVYRKKGTGFEEVKIEVGEEFEGQIEVTKGLSEGDVIYDITP